MDSELDSFFAEIKEIDTDAPTGEDALTPGPKLSSSSVAASGSVQPAVPSQMTVAAAPTALASVTAVSAAPSATITVAAKPPMPQASNEGNKAQLIAQEDAAQRQHPVGYSSNRNSGLAQFLGHPQQGHTEHYMSGAQQGYEYGHQQPHDYQLQSQQQQYSFQTEYQGHRGQGNVIGVAVTAGSAGSGVAAGVGAGAAGGVAPPQAPRQEKKFVRKAAGETWVDDTLQEWPENDYRIFVGDIGKEVSNDMLAKTFQHYKSFAKAKVGDTSEVIIYGLAGLLK